MKRSEFLELLEEKVEGCFGVYDSYVLGFQIESLLEMIEKHMIPRKIVNPIYKDKYKTYMDYVTDYTSHKAHGSNVNFEEYYINEWEQE